LWGEGGVGLARPSTLNPKLQTRNPKPYTLNSRPKTLNPKVHLEIFSEHANVKQLDWAMTSLKVRALPFYTYKHI